MQFVHRSILSQFNWIVSLTNKPAYSIWLASSVFFSLFLSLVYLLILLNARANVEFFLLRGSNCKLSSAGLVIVVNNFKSHLSNFQLRLYVNFGVECEIVMSQWLSDRSQLRIGVRFRVTLSYSKYQKWNFNQIHTYL